MKMKSISAIFSLFILYSCSNDNNTTNVEPISELTLNNLKSLPSNIPQDFYNDLTFINENTGYAVSRMGIIVKTIDGGINWTSYSILGDLYLKKVQFINTNIGFVIGGNASGSFLIKTTNAGQTWIVIDLHSTGSGFPTGMFFKNENEGYITGNKLFIKTTDGGLHWTNVLPNVDEDFKDVNFKDNNFGIVTLNKGDYYKTTNGGLSWDSVKLDDQYTLNEIYFVSGKTYIRSGNQLVDINTKTTISIPSPASKLQFLSTTKSIGIGQHFEIGFFPYGDILLTNDNWSNFLQKSYQPSSEVMDFTAIAKMSNHKTMILGTGQLNTEVITITY